MRHLEAARESLAQAGRSRPVGLSQLEREKWPADAVGELSCWQVREVNRVHIAVGSDDIPERIRQVAGFGG